MQICPSCNATNEPGEEVCFKCGRGLSGITEGALVGGRYEVQSRLGRGGMGVVYRAHDRELDEIVALKILRPDAAANDLTRRFRSEIKLARRVTHRNVCRIHEFGRDHNVAYIVMEYVDGVDFKRILHERRRLPHPEAYEVAIQIADALQAIHDEDIVHRDLKTANIMRDTRGAVKLMDFGIAKSFESAEMGATATGHIVGTPEYMSPEQARAAKVDGRSDIYALGIVIFELFTGDVPFRGDNTLRTLLMHLEDTPVLEVAGLPAVLVPVLQRTLAKAPEDRFQSARELADALRLARTQSLVVEATPLPLPTARSALPALPSLETQTTPMPTPVATAIPILAPQAVPSKSTTPAHAAATRGAQTLEAQPLAQERGIPGAIEPAAPLRPTTLPTKPVTPRRASTRHSGWLIAIPGVVVLGIGGILFLLLVQGARQGRVPAESAPSVSLPSVAPMTTPAASTLVSRAEPASPIASMAPAPAEVPSGRPLAAPPPGPRATPEARATSPPTTRGPVPDPTPPSVLPVPQPPESPVPTPLVEAPPSVAGPPTSSTDQGLKDATTASSESVSPSGMLQLVVIPWAEVEVDGVSMGTSPPLKPLSLPGGVHLVKLTHPNYVPFPRKVTIRPGETTKLQVDLTKEAFPK